MISTKEHPISTGYAPSWASGWGQDQYGIFAEIKFGKVIQRMRWVFPGEFWMGSPGSEKGEKWEGPRHQVKLTKGFWLAETPCTQELWVEVMGENPSRFQSPRRPVERVSWEDCQHFFEAAEERQPGLQLRLPTEAQWEYACRADTAEATWKGDLEILGERNAPLLDSIAWYGGNSGVNFDLEEGYNSSGWEECQHPHNKAGTREVKLKGENPWGFYDMLGNVYEWCSDHWNFRESYFGESRTDPDLTWDGSGRVIRGGSWASLARFVRAASRSGDSPDDRSTDVGFRLSQGSE